MPSYFQSILWDTNIKILDLRKDMVSIIIRSLQFGDRQHTNWIFKQYGQEKVKEVFKKNINYFDIRSANYWKLYLNLKVNLKNIKSINEKINSTDAQRNFK